MSFQIPRRLALAGAVVTVLHLVYPTCVAVAEVPMALDHIITGSSGGGIFVGRVIGSEEHTSDKLVLGVFPSRVTTFEVLESLTPTIRKGTNHSVKEFMGPGAAPKLKENAVVLWFVTKPSEAGFATPCANGDFREPEELEREGGHRRLVKNQAGGHLWGPGPLWNSKTFPREAATAFLLKYLRERHPLLGGPVSEPAQQKEEILSVGDHGHKSSEVTPLDLLLAATYARLSTIK